MSWSVRRGRGVVSSGVSHLQTVAQTALLDHNSGRLTLRLLPEGRTPALASLYRRGPTSVAYRQALSRLGVRWQEPLYRKQLFASKFDCVF